MTNYLETTIDKFHFKVAKDRYYSEHGIWLLNEEGATRIGLSDYLQQTSGDIAFAEPEPEGTVVVRGDEIASIETIKVDLEILSPISGKIVKTNSILEMTPETINTDPYGEGWVCEIEPTDWETDRELLLNPEEYFALMTSQAEEEVKKR